MAKNLTKEQFDRLKKKKAPKKKKSTFNLANPKKKPAKKKPAKKKPAKKY